MRNFIILISLFTTACGSGELPAPTDICEEPNPADDGRPDVLVIGDSISLGYTPYTVLALPDLDVQHNPCNARTSRNGVLNIDSWLARRPHWDMVTFNFGIWDALDAYAIDEDEYRSNLHEVAQKIKAKATKVVFFLTTDIPENASSFTSGDEDRLNEIALEVMQAEGIPVVDLNAVSKNIPQNMKEPKGVHYSNEGYAILSQTVSATIGAEF